MFSDLILTKSFPAAIRRVREHRALGHRTVLITGALDLAIGPLRPLFDDIVAPSLARRADGTYRGELTDVPPTGEARAQALFDYADANGFDVAEGVAYADSTSDLPMLEAVGFPVAVNPETRLAALARKRGLARRALRQGARARPQPLLPIGPEWGRPRRRRVGKVDTVGARPDEGARVLAASRPSSPPPWSRAGSRPAAAPRSGPSSLRDVDPPELPGPGWVRVRPRLSGICGSDLATIDGTSSRWFEPIVSFPFTPGHEVVGDLDDGTRVVVVPVLSCVARGIAPVCDAVRRRAASTTASASASATSSPGLQCGFCESTGGGLVDADGRPREPAGRRARRPLRRGRGARRAHRLRGARRRAGRRRPGRAHRQRHARPAHHRGAAAAPVPTVELLATAKHPHQRALAAELGADVVVAPGELERARPEPHRHRCATTTASSAAAPRPSSTASARRSPSPRRCASRRPAAPSTPSACPASPPSTSRRSGSARSRCGAPTPTSGPTSTPPSSSSSDLDLGRLVTATYPLRRYEDAIAHAASAGARGAVKIAFDLRSERERDSI